MRFGMQSGRNRIEQEAARRRARAHDHLRRVRNQRTQYTRGSLPALPAPALLAGAGLVALVLGVWIGDDTLAHLGEPWRVQAVEVRGAERLTGVEVARAAGVAPGDDYRHAEPAALVGALREHAWVADARATRLPGGTVVLEVRERQALAAIDARGGPLGVDAEGRPFAVLEPGEAVALPRLRCERTPAPGEADPRLAEAIRVARLLPERGLPLPREVQVGGESDPEGLVLRLPELEARIVLGVEEHDERVATLAELLAKRRAEVAEATSVDLRFAGQAVLQGKSGPKGSTKAAS